MLTIKNRQPDKRRIGAMKIEKGNGK